MMTVLAYFGSSINAPPFSFTSPPSRVCFSWSNRRYLLQLVYIQSHAICNWNNLAQLPFGTTRMEQSFSEEVEFLEASNIPCIIIQRQKIGQMMSRKNGLDFLSRMHHIDRWISSSAWNWIQETELLHSLTEASRISDLLVKLRVHFFGSLLLLLFYLLHQHKSTREAEKHPNR